MTDTFSELRSIATKLDIAILTSDSDLVVRHFNEGWLVVRRGSEAMEAHHDGSNLGKSRDLDVSPELHSRMQARASNGNWDLQDWQRC
jgi:hypothetical protein